MSKSKTAATPNKAIAKENETGLQVFDGKKVTAAVKAISAARTAGDEAKTIGATAAMSFMELVATFVTDANEAGVTDTSTQLDNWKANIALTARKLADNGHAAATHTTDKEGAVNGAKLVGYPANCDTTARGVVDFGIDITKVTPKDENKGVSYRDIAEAVRTEKASRRPQAVIDLAEAKQDAKEVFEELLAIVSQDDDTPLVRELVEALEAMKGKALADFALIAEMEKAEQAEKDAAVDLPPLDDDAALELAEHIKAAATG